MSDELAELWVHTVTTEPYLSENAIRKLYGPETEPIPCFLSDSRKNVRTAAGDIVISESTITANREQAPSFTEGSLVHLPTRIATVIKIADNSSGDLELPDHIEVNLT